MAMGMGVMRFSPAAFLAMTPKEFVAATGAVVPGGAEAPGRTELSELMGRFPDR